MQRVRSVERHQSVDLGWVGRSEVAMMELSAARSFEDSWRSGLGPVTGVIRPRVFVGGRLNIESDILTDINEDVK